MRGFSLIELIIAVALSSLVLVGVVSISTSMVRSQMEGIRRGSVTGWSLVNFVNMTREIESSNVMVSPTTTSDVLLLCKNWSRLMAASPGARLDATQPLEIVYYCFNQGTRTIWRYYRSGAALTCPLASALGACGAGLAAYSQTPTAVNVERIGLQPVFTREASGGVRLHYVVGEQTPSPQRPIPVFIPYELSVNMQKAYGNASD